jgi:hypothetical protein
MSMPQLCLGLGWDGVCTLMRRPHPNLNYIRLGEKQMAIIFESAISLTDRRLGSFGSNYHSGVDSV